MSFVSSANAFLVRTTGIEVGSLPRVRVSRKVKDSAWYSSGTIFINPDYNPEGLTPREMVAHEFFHHVQHKLGIKLGKNKLESSAMFFSGAFLNKGSGSKIVAYLRQKKHMPRGGNKYVLSVFRKNRYDVASTLTYFLKKKH